MEDRIEVRKVRSVPLLFIIAPIILAVGFFLIGFANSSTYLKNKPYFVETEATISRIEVETIRSYDYDEEETKIVHTVYIDYFVDGESYLDVEYDGYKVGMKEGDIIKINYDLRDPSIVYPTENSSGWLIIIALVIVAGYIIIGPIVIYKTRSARSKILNSGECHRVKIVGLVNEKLEPIKPELKDQFCPKFARIKVLYNETPYYSDMIEYTKDVTSGDMIDLYLDRELLNKNRTSRVAKFRKTTNKVSNYYLDLNSIIRG